MAAPLLALLLSLAALLSASAPPARSAPASLSPTPAPSSPSGLHAGAEGGGCALTYLEVTRLRPELAGADIEGSMSSPRDVLSHLTAWTGVEGETVWPDNAAVPVTAAAQLASPANLPMAAVWHHYFSSWDGRAEGLSEGSHALLGTPGGDLGEFVLALAAVERLRAEQADFSREEIGNLFDKWVGGRKKFYMQTGKQLHDQWAEHVGHDPLSPETKEQVDLVLESAADYIGCQHLRLMMRNHGAYGVRLRLVRDVIRTVVAIKINPLHPDTDKILVAVLDGTAGEEDAFVNVLSPDPSDGSTSPEAVRCQYLAPLVVPRVGSRSVMVYHPRAVYEYRAMLAAFMAQKLGRDTGFRDELFQTMATLGNAAMQLTKRQVLPGRPSFVARFMVAKPAGGLASPTAHHEAGAALTSSGTGTPGGFGAPARQQALREPLHH